MNKFHKFMIIAGVFLASMLLFSVKAEAATTIFQGETHSPALPRTTCNGGVPVDFAAYITNVSLNLTSGRISYQVRVGWKSCNNIDDTRAYAIWASPQICPVSGWYGENGIATDCVKYVGNPPHQGAGNGLSCPQGQNGDCVTTEFFSAIRTAQEPPTFPDSAVIPMSYLISNWPTVKQSAGSRTIGSQMCQFYKTGANFNTSVNNSRCVNMSITVSWSVELEDKGTCTVALTGAPVLEPGETRRVDYSFYNQGEQAWSVNPAHSTRHRLRNQNPAPWPGAPTELEIRGTGVEDTVFGPVLRGGRATSWRYDITVPASLAPGTYTFNWRIFGYSTGGTNPHWDGQSCPLTFQVKLPFTKPYPRVYRNDIAVGRGFTLNNACTFNNNAGIESFTKSTPFGYAGAGSQFAVTATGVINEFMSNSMHNLNIPHHAVANGSLPPLGTTFGNYAPSGKITTYPAGQDGGSLMNCMPNYYEEFSAQSGAVNLAPTVTVTPGQPVRKYGGRAVGPNDPMVYYYDGDLIITGPMTYSTTWSSPEAIPKVYVVVRGNIYVAPGVTELNGIYIAQPRNDGSKGIFNTCADYGRTLADCDQPLSVKGAVIAKKIELNRLGGDLDTQAVSNEDHNVNNHAAETFVFSPEYWLGNPVTWPLPTRQPGAYDSIVSLPPVL